jgi:hypothetical protein
MEAWYTAQPVTSISSGINLGQYSQTASLQSLVRRGGASAIRAGPAAPRQALTRGRPAAGQHQGGP